MFLPKSFAEFKQLFLVEDIDAHRRFGRIGVFRLFGELVDLPIVMRGQNAEAACLLQRHLQHRDGAVCVLLFVIAQHVRIVHAVDVVAREDDDVFGVILVDERHVLIDGVCRALVPVGFFLTLVGRQDLDAAVGAVEIPRQTVADVVVQHQRLILCQHADRVNAGIDAVGKRKVDDAILAPEGDCGLCGGFRQCVQTGTLTAGKKHGDAFFSFFVHSIRTSEKF